MGPLVVIVFLQLFLVVLIAAYVWQTTSGVISGSLHTPFVPTRKKHIARIAEALRIEHSDIVYELGSGDGRVLLLCAARAPEATFIGIERNIFLYALSKLRAYFAGNPRNVSFRRENIFGSDIRNATRVYFFLLPSVMDQLLPKLERELSGVRLASYAFRFRTREPAEKIHLSGRPLPLGEDVLYIYKF